MTEHELKQLEAAFAKAMGPATAALERATALCEKVAEDNRKLALGISVLDDENRALRRQLMKEASL